VVKTGTKPSFQKKVKALIKRDKISKGRDIWFKLSPAQRNAVISWLRDNRPREKNVENRVAIPKTRDMSKGILNRK
jgi:hypothetical protein